MENKTMKKQFGLPTAISMIVGIVIGSGIFFKTDDILLDTNGSVLYGAIALVIGAIGIIFGGLTLSKLSEKSEKTGGLITYCEIAFGKRFAYFAGFYQMGIYFPALLGVILYVAANYTCMLFEDANLNIWVITLLYFFGTFAINYLSARLASYFQNISTVIKILPLVIIGYLGIRYGHVHALQSDTFSMAGVVASSSAIVAVAFSYDGWTVAPAVAHEIKNAKRNLSLALAISPIIIMMIYLIYFVGMSSILGPDKIMALGDNHVQLASVQLFGENGSKFVLVAIIISVLGTVNGLTLAAIRVPYALAIRKELPHSEQYVKVNAKTNIPTRSTILMMVITGAWMFAHFLTTKIPAFSSIDISSIPIFMMYLIYLILFVSVIHKYILKEVRGVFRGLICPVFACMGALMVISGAILSPMIKIYVIVSFLFIIIGVIIYEIAKKQR